MIMLDKSSIFEILREQNYWFRDPASTRFITRSYYLENMSSFLNSKAILFVKGPRRAGKTVLIDLIIREMIYEKRVGREQILYVNLEDYRFYNHYSVQLLEKILESYLENIGLSGQLGYTPVESGMDAQTTFPDDTGIGDTDRIYFFIDEIQHIPGFEHFLRTKYDMNSTGMSIKFIVTGSNAQLLSKELGTLLTGRMVSMEVFPFSFEEFLRFFHMDVENRSYFTLEPRKMKIRQMFNRYLRYGGIPEFLDEPDPERRLQEYFENVISRDIVERFNIRNVRQIKELALYLLTNSASLFSMNKISKTFGTSINTIITYLSDLESSYLFFYLRQYSASFKNQITTQSKVYCLDTGLMNAVGFRFSEGRGHQLENLVYLHLLRTGKEVYYHRNSTTHKECDFLVKEGLNILQVIQVTRDLGSNSTRTREIEGLVDAAKAYDLDEGLILTDDEFDSYEHDNVKIRVRPVWFWLLNSEG